MKASFNDNLKDAMVTSDVEEVTTHSPKEIFWLGELFSGPGGLAWGAVNADNDVYCVKHAWSNDYDKATCATYTRNICPDRPETVYCQDIKTLDIGKLGPIDAFAFGFPCNDYSLVGEKKGLDGKFGPLYSYGVKVLNTYHPKWFVAENVGGLRCDQGGSTFNRILDELEASGYKIYPHYYKFEEYGVPQRRHRIIIVGIREDFPFDFHVPSPKPYEGIDVSCRKAIEEPPISAETPNNERTNQSDHVIARLGYIQPGENAFNANIPEELKLHVKGAKLSQIYKRLVPDKPAYTITGSGGGGTHVYHWSEPRALTNRERARLQTFPDDFVFVGSKEQVRRQIGMAVPCNGAKIIVEAILNTFAGIEYQYVRCNIDRQRELF